MKNITLTPDQFQASLLIDYYIKCILKKDDYLNLKTIQSLLKDSGIKLEVNQKDKNQYFEGLINRALLDQDYRLENNNYFNVLNKELLDKLNSKEEINNVKELGEKLLKNPFYNKVLTKKNLKTKIEEYCKTHDPGNIDLLTDLLSLLNQKYKYLSSSKTIKDYQYHVNEVFKNYDDDLKRMLHHVTFVELKSMRSVKKNIRKIVYRSHVLYKPYFIRLFDILFDMQVFEVDYTENQVEKQIGKGLFSILKKFDLQASKKNNYQPNIEKLFDIKSSPLYENYKKFALDYYTNVPIYNLDEATIGHGRKKLNDYFSEEELIYLYYLLQTSNAPIKIKENLFKKIAFLVPKEVISDNNLFIKENSEADDTRDNLSTIRTIREAIKSHKLVRFHYIKDKNEEITAFPFSIVYDRYHFEMECIRVEKENETDTRITISRNSGKVNYRIDRILDIECLDQGIDNYEALENQFYENDLRMHYGFTDYNIKCRNNESLVPVTLLEPARNDADAIFKFLDNYELYYKGRNNEEYGQSLKEKFKKGERKKLQVNVTLADDYGLLEGTNGELKKTLYEYWAQGKINIEIDGILCKVDSRSRMNIRSTLKSFELNTDLTSIDVYYDEDLLTSFTEEKINQFYFVIENCLDEKGMIYSDALKTKLYGYLGLIEYNQSIFNQLLYRQEDGKLLNKIEKVLPENKSKAEIAKDAFDKALKDGSYIEYTYMTCYGKITNHNIVKPVRYKNGQMIVNYLTQNGIIKDVFDTKECKLNPERMSNINIIEEIGLAVRRNNTPSLFEFIDEDMSF